jgi:hypothetical protein
MLADGNDSSVQVERLRKGIDGLVGDAVASSAAVTVGSMRIIRPPSRATVSVSWLAREAGRQLS